MFHREENVKLHQPSKPVEGCESSLRRVRSPCPTATYELKAKQSHAKPPLNLHQDSTTNSAVAHAAKLNKHTALVGRIERLTTVEPNSGCVLWTGSVAPAGYAQLKIDGEMIGAHRVAYELHRGSIPDGLVIDHLCRVRSCVNPWHLEPVTNKENALRGISPCAVNARKDYCDRGHPLFGFNLYVSPDQHRHCRECTEVSREKYRAKKRALSAREVAP